MLAKSRVPELEKALSDELIPSKKKIVRDNTQNEVEDRTNNSNMILEASLHGLNEQLEALRGLCAKNEDVIEHMMNKVKRQGKLRKRPATLAGAAQRILATN